MSSNPDPGDWQPVNTAPLSSNAGVDPGDWKTVVPGTTSAAAALNIGRGAGAEKDIPEGGVFDPDKTGTSQFTGTMLSSRIGQDAQRLNAVISDGWQAGVDLAKTSYQDMMAFLTAPGPERAHAIMDLLSGDVNQSSDLAARAIPGAGEAIRAAENPWEDNDFTRLAAAAVHTATIGAAPAEAGAWEMAHAGGLAAGMKEKDARDAADKAALATSTIVLSIPALAHLSENGPYADYQKALKEGRIAPEDQTQAYQRQHMWDDEFQYMGVRPDLAPDVDTAQAPRRPNALPSPQKTIAERLQDDRVAQLNEKTQKALQAGEPELPPSTQPEPPVQPEYLPPALRGGQPPIPGQFQGAAAEDFALASQGQPLAQVPPWQPQAGPPIPAGLQRGAEQDYQDLIAGHAHEAEAVTGEMAQQAQPDVQTLEPAYKYQNADLVDYQGTRYRVVNRPEVDGKIELMRKNEDGTVGRIDVPEDSPFLKVVNEQPELRAAAQLDDGRVVVGSRGSHQSLAGDMDKAGIPFDSVEDTGWVDKNGDFHSDREKPPTPAEALDEPVGPRPGEPLKEFFRRREAAQETKDYARSMATPDDVRAADWRQFKAANGIADDVPLPKMSGIKAEDLPQGKPFAEPPEPRRAPPGLGSLFGEAVTDAGQNLGNEKGFLELSRKTPAERRLQQLRMQAGERVGLNRFNPLAGFTTRHSLRVLEEAPGGAPAYLSARAAAHHRGAARALTFHDFSRAIDSVTKPGTAQTVLETLHASQLEGLKDRYTTYAKKAVNADPKDLLEWFKTSGHVYAREAVDHFEKDPKLATQAKAKITRAFSNGNVDELRGYLGELFTKAANEFPRMSAERREFMQTPEYKKGIKAAEPYFQSLENMLQEGGGQQISKEFLGPAGRYIPLLSDAPEDEGPIRERHQLAFGKRKVGIAQTRTGFGQYNPTIENLTRTFGNSYRAIKLNQTIANLKQAGLMVDHEPGKDAPTSMEAIPGAPERPMEVRFTPDRDTTDAYGVSRPIPGKRGYMPESIGKPMSNIFDPNNGLSSYEKLELTQNHLLDFILSGPLEPTLHGKRVVSNLMHATGEDLATVTARLGSLNMSGENALRHIREMAEDGQISNRYGTTSASKELAFQLGWRPDLPNTEKQAVQYHNPLGGKLNPTLYGPYGIDLRASIVARQWIEDWAAKARGIELTRADKVKFVDQLGVYANQIKSKTQRFLQNAALQPFIGARATALRNTMEELGMSPSSLPPGAGRVAKFKFNLMRHMRNSMLGAIATWIVANKLMHGKWPWEDKKAKFLQLHMDNDSYFVKHFGSLFYSDSKDTTKYLSLALLFPAAFGIARFLGADRYANARMRGANEAQAEEQLGAGLASQVISAITGPILGSGQSFAGFRAYVNSFHDERTGRISMPQMMPSMRTTGPGLHIPQRIAAAGGDVAPMIEGGLDQAFPKKGDDKFRSRLQRLATSIALGIVGSEENVGATRARYSKEKK